MSARLFGVRVGAREKCLRTRGGIPGIVITLLVIALVLPLLFTGNITVECGEESLNVTASYYGDLVVRYEEIDALEYVEQGVDGRRISGFASPRLSLGSFRNDTLGSYTRYTYTKQTACILLSVGERSIVIGCESEEQTRAVYDALCARIEQ